MKQPMRHDTETIPLRPDLQNQAADVLTRAFLDDELYIAVFEGRPEKREFCLRNLWKGVLQCSLRYGRVDTTPELEGAACWLLPGKTALSFMQMISAGGALISAMASFPARERKRAMHVIEAADRTRADLMKDKPYWYLWALGVDPACQGRGIGSQLINPVLSLSEPHKIPCYLETQTESNVAFYQKRGFQVVKEESFPGLGVQLWMMVRNP